MLGVAFWLSTLIPVSDHMVDKEHFLSLEDFQKRMKLANIYIPLWAAAVASIKLSVVAMLFRLLDGRPWRYFFYFMTAIQIAFIIYVTLFTFLQCRPVSMLWNVDPNLREGHCVSDTAVKVYCTMVAITCIGSDFILSLIPVTFAMRLKRPLAERLLVCALMAMGIVASAASIMRTYLLSGFNKADDVLAWNISVNTWACIEILLGVIAASMPHLKIPLETMITRAGKRLSAVLPAPTIQEIYPNQVRRTTDLESGGSGPTTPLPWAKAGEILKEEKDDRHLSASSDSDKSPASSVVSKPSFASDVYSSGKEDEAVVENVRRTSVSHGEVTILSKEIA